MDKEYVIAYYSRTEIQKEILKHAKNREIGVLFDGYFGKRPSVIDYLSDIKIMVNKGVFSFHCSEERWENALLLANDKNSEIERSKNRIGWDLILDLDGVDYVYAQIVGDIIIKKLYEYNIKNVSVKFSGNKGFHIAIPFEAFSSHYQIINETRNYFPDAPRKIVQYLMYELQGVIAKAIIKHDGSIDNISRKYKIPMDELIVNNDKSLNFNFMKVIEVDTILIASRHLYRMPYSLNEKSGLVSIPVHPEKLLEFTKEQAKPENVNPEKYVEFEFLNYNPEYGKDANILLEKTDDVNIEDIIINEVQSGINEYTTKESGPLTIDKEVTKDDFPETIKYIISTDFVDGRKRALFVLLTYFYSINWKYEEINPIIDEWNNNQTTQLKKQYINAQISWFNTQQKSISCPNYDNDNYYKSINIPEETIKKDINAFKKIKAKNPLHYTYLKTKGKIDNPKEKNKKNNDAKNTNKEENKKP